MKLQAFNESTGCESVSGLKDGRTRVSQRGVYVVIVDKRERRGEGRGEGGTEEGEREGRKGGDRKWEKMETRGRGGNARGA